ncbi:MAG: VWA domain-containing protein [Candidatus Omnitrophica bacterium]|nr:VWA domain-containing protein [Candidatus Omnitrophota bacterium]
MSFAAPLGLLFFGLFIPVILLYLLKQKRRRMQVSTLLFWDQILRDEQTVTSITKLKKLLSLLLQLLFITLLALALARPLFSKDFLGARRIVLFVDNSASMLVKEGERTRFALAKEKAQEVIRGVSMGDTLLLASVSDRVDILQSFSDSRKDLLDKLETLEPTHSPTDFGPAISIMENLPPDERDTFVYIVSDGAFSEIPFEAPDKMHIAYLKVGEEVGNIGITSFQVRPLPTSPRDLQVHLEVTNRCEEEKRVPMEFRVNGRLADASELVLPPKEKVVKTLQQFSNEGGEVEVIIDYDDSFPLDNRAFAVLPSVEPIPVLLVTDGNLFLESSLATDEEIDLDIMDLAGYLGSSTEELHSHTVTIFDRSVPETRVAGNAIYIGAWPTDLGVVASGTLETPLFSDWDREHRVNRHLNLSNISIQKALRIEDPGSLQTLASSFEFPLVLIEEGDKSSTLVVAFDTTQSDFPLRVAFPIMISNTIRHMARLGGEEKWRTESIGSILSATEISELASTRSGALGATEEWTSWVRPDEDKDEKPNLDLLVRVDRIGVYRGKTNADREIPLFAVNLGSEVESDIAPREELPLVSENEIPKVSEGLRLGTEPWFYLVLLGLVLSVTEWGLFHRRVVE